MYQFSSPTLMKNSCNRLISQYFNTTENTRELNMMVSMEWFLLEVSASTSQNEDEQ